MGMARSMIKQKGLRNFFWAEAIATSIYLVNRAPTKALSHQTPFQAWYGRKPSVHHLKTFGCIAYGLIPSQNRKQLDNKSEKCIFIGYSSQSKGYRLYNPSNKKFLTRRDVVFIEGQKWIWQETNYENNLNSIYCYNQTSIYQHFKSYFSIKSFHFKHSLDYLTYVH